MNTIAMETILYGLNYEEQEDVLKYILSIIPNETKGKITDYVRIKYREAYFETRQEFLRNHQNSFAKTIDKKEKT